MEMSHVEKSLTSWRLYKWKKTYKPNSLRFQLSCDVNFTYLVPYLDYERISLNMGAPPNPNTYNISIYDDLNWVRAKLAH